MELTTCKASELIAALQQFIDSSGDLPVYIKDADTDWALPVHLSKYSSYYGACQNGLFMLHGKYSECHGSEDYAII